MSINLSAIYAAAEPGLEAQRAKLRAAETEQKIRALAKDVLAVLKEFETGSQCFEVEVSYHPVMGKRLASDDMEAGKDAALEIYAAEIGDGKYSVLEIYLFENEQVCLQLRRRGADKSLTSTTLGSGDVEKVVGEFLGQVVPADVFEKIRQTLDEQQTVQALQAPKCAP